MTLGTNVATLLGYDEQHRDDRNERCNVVVFYSYKKHVKIPTLGLLISSNTTRKNAILDIYYLDL